MANKLKDLWLRAIALVDRGANSESHVVLAKAEHGFGSMEECVASGKDEATCKELMAAIKAGTQTAGTGQTVILDLTKVEDTMPDNDVAKALAEAKAESVAVKKALADAQADAKAAKEAVAKMENDRQHQVFIVKAQEFTALPGVNPDDFGPLLRKAYAGLTAEEQGKFDTILRGAVKVAQDSALFSEIGANPNTPSGGAYAKLEAMAKGLIEKSQTPLTFAQAMAKVEATPEGRALYKQYDAELANEAARRVR